MSSDTLATKRAICEHLFNELASGRLLPPPEFSIDHKHSGTSTVTAMTLETIAELEPQLKCLDEELANMISSRSSLDNIQNEVRAMRESQR